MTMVPLLSNFYKTVEHKNRHSIRTTRIADWRNMVEVEWAAIKEDIH